MRRIQLEHSIKEMVKSFVEQKLVAEKDREEVVSQMLQCITSASGCEERAKSAFKYPRRYKAWKVWRKTWRDRGKMQSEYTARLYASTEKLAIRPDRGVRRPFKTIALHMEMRTRALLYPCVELNPWEAMGKKALAGDVWIDEYGFMQIVSVSAAEVQVRFGAFLSTNVDVLESFFLGDLAAFVAERWIKETAQFYRGAGAVSVLEAELVSRRVEGS